MLRTHEHQDALPVAIIGGGPVGLAAAAELAKRGEPFMLFEAGNDVASNIWAWKHVRVFSPWRYNMAEAAVELLEADGWQSPDLTVLPTGEELVNEYFRPLANVPEIQPYVYFNARVTSIGRKGLDKMVTQGREDLPFVVQVDVAGTTQSYEARAVIDASGTWDNPNPIGSGGIAAQGEREAHKRIFYGIPNVLGDHRVRYAGKKVMAVGSGHSSINALLDLLALKDEEPTTEVIWVLRKKQMQRVYGGGTADALPARGALGIRIQAKVEAGELEVLAPFYISELSQVNDKFDVKGKLDGDEMVVSGVDEVIANTGSRPDISFLREVRASFDPVLESVPELAPLIDPNIHSCGTVRPHGELELRQPEKDFYVVGVKSYGRVPTFLMATGYEQVRSVVSALVGDWEAAARVQLDLPQTGVCSSNRSSSDQASGGCCGPEESTAGELVTASVSSSCCGPEEPMDEALSVALSDVLRATAVSSSCCGPEQVAEGELVAATVSSSCCGPTQSTEDVSSVASALSSCCGPVEAAIPATVDEPARSANQSRHGCC
ncbi:MAG: NAD(P)-binding domain-containing protein [Chloroflexota bacterium]